MNNEPIMSKWVCKITIQLCNKVINKGKRDDIIVIISTRYSTVYHDRGMTYNNVMIRFYIKWKGLLFITNIIEMYKYQRFITLELEKLVAKKNLLRNFPNQKL